MNKFAQKEGESLKEWTDRITNLGKKKKQRTYIKPITWVVILGIAYLIWSTILKAMI